MDRIKLDQFKGGMNNVASRERIPKGQVAGLLNLDPLADGRLERRAGAVRIADGGLGVWGLNDSLYTIDAAGKVVRHDTELGLQTAELGTVGTVSEVRGLTLYDRVVIATERGLFHCNENGLAKCALDTAAWNLSAGAGLLPAGQYKVCVRAEVDDPVTGYRQGGGTPRAIKLTDAGALVVTANPPTGVNYRLYASVQDGDALYDQGLISGIRTLTTVHADGARLTNPLLFDANQHVARIAVCDGVLASVITVNPNDPMSRFVWLHAPMEPHLLDRMGGFVPFGEPVLDIHGAGGGRLLAATASSTWLLSGIHSMQELSVAKLDGHRPIPGTFVTLPDNRVSWMSAKGQAFLGSEGIQHVTQNRFHPPTTARAGAAGVVVGDGREMIASVLRGSTMRNALVVADKFEIEVLQA